MKIHHHPAADSLMSCSAGSMPEAFAAVMASHISVCATCQRELALMELIGAALFDQLSPSQLDHAAPVMELRRREAGPDAHMARGSKDGIKDGSKDAGGDVPEPLVAVVGRYLDDLAWKRVSPGVSIHDVALSSAAKGNLRLIKAAPGKALPVRGHAGSELMLVLRGGCHDAQGDYRLGDVSDVGDDVVDPPVADAVEGCICLVATRKKLRFKSILARLIQPVTGM